VRAIGPTQSDQLKIADFQIGYETFGDPSALSVLLLPTWPGVHSRLWKMQVHYLSRFFHVITYDSPGNGAAERTTNVAAFEYDRIADQGIGLLDHLGVARAAVIAISRGCCYALDMAGRYPTRVTQVVLISNFIEPDFQFIDDPACRERRDTYEGWQKWNYHYCVEHFHEMLEWLANTDFSEPYSSKAKEDFIAWGLETEPEILATASFHPRRYPKTTAHDLIGRVHCPVLILQGEKDQWSEDEANLRLVQARPDWELVTLNGCGHIPNARDPVKVNLEIAEFLGIRG